MPEPILSTSVVYISGEAIKGEVAVCNDLLGKYVHDIAGGGDRPIALCHDGNFFCDNAEQLPNIGVRVSNLAIGRSSQIAMTEDGLLYSWGLGIYGELGLGACSTELSYPTRVEHTANFIAISSGESHTVALDAIGNVYAWGQNFDRQLGIYTKEASKMSKPNCLIQDMSFAPRVIPLTLKVPVSKISCGSKFTAVLSKVGEVWTWGAGDCGQLGTGRCTRREVPSRVPFPPKVLGGNNTGSSSKLADVKISDIACGSSHVIARSESDELYGWGMNKRGQLGLGDTDTRQQPVLITALTAKKIFADGYSSAAIDGSGSVYTWGSGAYFRLMHSDDGHRSSPAMVSALQGNTVHSFAFARSSSAALVLTKLYDLTPTSGPQRSFGEIRIRGCGFWDSGSIVVKFSSASANSFVPPRSVPGKIIAPGVISCKPPKLAETGEFDVAVAIDGEVFVKDALRVNIYKEFNVAALSPNLIDGRESTEMPVTLTISGLVLPKDDIARSHVYVKFLIETMHSAAAALEEEEHEEGAHRSGGPETDDEVTEIIVEGKLLPEEERHEIIPHREEHNDDDDNAVAEAETPKGAARSARRIPDRFVVCDLPSSAIPQGKLMSIHAKASLNHWDFTQSSPEGVGTIICHTFEPLLATPSCVPCDPMPETKADDETEHTHAPHSVPEEICIRGESLFPAGKLAESMSLEATFSASASHIEGGSVWPVEFHIPVRCATGTEMYLVPPTLNDVIAQMPPPTPRPEPEVKFELPPEEPAPPAKKAGRTASQASMQSQQSQSKIQVKPEPPPPPPEPHTLNQVRGFLKFYLLIKESSGNVTKTLLSPSEVPLDLYFPQQILVDPILTRKTGGAIVSLRGKSWSGYRFTSATSRVVLRRPGSDAEISISGKHITFTVVGNSPRKSRSAGGVSTARSGVSELQDGFGTAREGDEVITDGRTDVTDDVEPEYKLSFLLPDVSAVFSLSDDDPEEQLQQQQQQQEGVIEEGKSPAIQRSASQEESPVDRSSETVSHLTVSLLMDGRTPPPSGHIAALVLFEHVQIVSANTPKGGFASGASVTLVIAGLPRSPFLTGTRECVVRLKGLDHPDAYEERGASAKKGKKSRASSLESHAAHGDDHALEHAHTSSSDAGDHFGHEEQPAVVDVTGTLKIESNEVTFVIPDAELIATLHPIMAKKDKTYFVAVSLDGGCTFDVSESPIIGIK